MHDLKMINPEKYTRPRMSKKTTEEDRWFSILGSEREHKGCWITCTSHSFFSSSSLLLILWLMNVKERERKRCLAKKKKKKDTPQIQGCCCCCCCCITTPQSKGFLCDDQKPCLGPSIILAIISCIYMKTHLLRPLLTKQ